VVGPKDRLRVDAFRLTGVNWLDARPIGPAGRALHVKHRANEAAIPARLHAVDDGIRVVPDDAATAVAPGQACVFYDGDRVLGGGWIERVEAHATAG